MKTPKKKKTVSLPNGKTCKVTIEPPEEDVEPVPDSMMDQLLKILSTPNASGKTPIELMAERMKGNKNGNTKRD